MTDPRRTARRIALLLVVLVAAAPLAAPGLAGHNPLHNDLTEPVVDLANTSCEVRDCAWLRLDGGFLDTASGEAAPGDLYWGAARVWDARNHGPGSGLDADLLDGLTSGQLLRSDASGALQGDLRIEGSAGRLLELRGDRPGDPNRAYLGFTDETGAELGHVGDALGGAPGISLSGARGLRFLSGGAERLAISEAGRVGIGTTSPGFDLVVRGPAPRIDVQNAADQERGGYLRDTGTTFEVGTHSGVRPLAFAFDHEEKMRIDIGGNVGIGTTSPQHKFVVSNGGAGGFEVAMTSNSPVLQAVNRQTSTYEPIHYAGAVHAWSIPDPSVGAATERMRIDGSGNLGLGTEDPQARLTVSSPTPHDGISVENAATSTTRIHALLSGDAPGPVSGRTFEGRIQADNVNDLVIGTNGPVPIGFYNSNGRRVTITGAGDVGVGTASPSYRLDVSGDNGFGYAARFAIPGGPGVGLGSLEGTPHIHGLRSSGGSADLTLQAHEGRVGIGTTSPVSKLEVSNPGAATTLTVTGSGGAGETVGDLAFRTLASNEGTDVLAGVRAFPDDNANVGALAFQTKGSSTDSFPATRMVIGSNGHVGIGTLSPATRLDVDGTVRSTGLSLSSAALGACDGAARGSIQVVHGAAGVADVLYMCMKSAADTFAWKPVVTG